MKTIVRQTYLDKIQPFIGKEIIKVLTGQRRVGKTTLLKQMMDFIKSTEESANIIYINKELNQFAEILNAEDLFTHVKNQVQKDSNNYVFIDEVQEVKDFEIALRRLFVEGLDIYCTGSNANMLSSDIATHLSGRYIEFQIQSLTYLEFLNFHQLPNETLSLNKYIRYGGMPYLIHLELEENIVYGYLRSIYNTIVLKDIVSRYNIRDVDFLDRLVEYLSDNLGSYVSSKKITDFLKSQGIKLSINTVMNYLNYLAQAFFIQKVQRYDIIGKKRFEINDKFYFSDLGIKHAIIPYQANDIGKVFENLVYNQLIYDGYHVFVGKWQDKEIDFVAKKGNETLYIQVAYLLPNDQVREREYGNLLNIQDNHTKMVVSADEFESDYKGIKHIHIREFLSRNAN